MRIANLMLGGKRGGIEQAAVDYARALADHGHESFLVLRRAADILPTARAAKVPVRLLPTPYRWNLLARRRLKRVLQGCDLVILHGNRAAELMAGLGLSVPTLAVAHSRFFDLRPEFHGVIALSQTTQDALAQRAGCPVYRLPNMVDVAELGARPAWRTTPVIGVMGRLAPIKGIDLLLQAAAMLHARGLDFALHIGGDGDEREALEVQAKRLGIAERITWLGWVSDKQAFFDSVDVFCLPSRSETFAITLLEAMAHGLPSVATDCGGTAEMLEGESGLLCTVTAEGIADALAQALTNQDATRAMGERAYARAAEQYARPNVASRLAALAQQAVDTPAPVLNVMFGKLRGGLEQAAVDYAEAMATAGIPHATVLSPGAHIVGPFAQLRLPHLCIPTAGWWDVLASARLRRIARLRGARAAICHGNRALSITRRALGGTLPVIAVAHNDRTEQFRYADACFCITTHARDRLLTLGLKREQLHLIPNMTRLPRASTPRTAHAAPVIGTLGRFIPRKGFHDWIAALALLAQRGVAFRAVLGGDGPERAALEQQVREAGLADHFTFSGWVENNASFYDTLNLFVMPSHYEPFGLVLIEAMAHGVPVISTAVEGPRDIVEDGRDALVVPPQDAAAMADAMARLLADETLARRLAAAGRARVEAEYSMDAMATRLKAALTEIISPA